MLEGNFRKVFDMKLKVGIILEHRKRAHILSLIFILTTIFIFAFPNTIKASQSDSRMQSAQGTYTGDGIDDRDITGVGFQPDLVIIKGGSNSAIWRSSTRAG